jgi:hypothetical protein
MLWEHEKKNAVRRESVTGQSEISASQNSPFEKIK